MTQDDAAQMIRDLFHAFGVESPGLNEQGFGGAAIGEGEIYFEYEAAGGALKCSALVYKFHNPPRPEILKSFQAEAFVANTGGGMIEYEPQSKGMYLARRLDSPLEPAAFGALVRRLIDASVAWKDQHIERIASRGNMLRN